MMMSTWLLIKLYKYLITGTFKLLWKLKWSILIALLAFMILCWLQVSGIIELDFMKFVES